MAEVAGVGRPASGGDGLGRRGLRSPGQGGRRAAEMARGTGDRARRGREAGGRRGWRGRAGMAGAGPGLAAEMACEEGERET